MSEQHELTSDGEEQDVEAHAASATDLEDNEPAGDDEVEAHIKFN